LATVQRISALTFAEPKPRSELSRAWTRFRTNRAALGSLCFVGLLIVLALLAPVIAPYGYATVDFDSILKPSFSPGHVLGTDALGRDVLSRLVYSLRTALTVGFSAELIALSVALVVGSLAAWMRGPVDQLLMAGTDVMYAFPSYLFSVVMVTVLGHNIGAVILAIGVASWVGQARLVRAQVLNLAQREYVEASRAMGARGPTIVLRHILPNALGPMLVTTAFGIPGAITAEAGLSLIGLGVAPPTPSWGAMITEGSRYVLSQPHMLLGPVALFIITLLAFTWIGDGIRDAFDITT
jgi:ABC-type dipeptide/oligopeptide/nickel transport system permease subunit